MQKLQTYRYLNILKHYRKLNGYVLKVLGYAEDTETGKRYLQGVYYKDRDRTAIPVRDGEYLLLMSYSDSDSTYILLETDSSAEDGFKEILSCSGKKHEVKKYLIDQNLISKMEIEEKHAQIEPKYAGLIEETLSANIECDQLLNLATIQEVLSRSIYYRGQNYSLMGLKSLYYKERELLPKEEELQLKDLFLTYTRASLEVQKIFQITGKDAVTVEEALKALETCATNYIYNL